jgi:hypothetical protein
VTELLVVAEVLLFQALSPARLLLEELRVDFVHAPVDIVARELVVVAPVLGDVIQRLLEVSAAVEHVALQRLVGVKQ